MSSRSDENDSELCLSSAHHLGRTVAIVLPRHIHSILASRLTAMSTAIPRNDEYPNNALLQSAKLGFDHLFSNDILEAKRTFACSDHPFHLLGLGVCAFLEAALGMEVRT